MSDRIKNNLKALRVEAGYSQSELAEMVNVAQNTISQYENGLRDIDNRVLILFTKIFSVSSDYILGLSDIKNPYEPQTIAAHHEGDEWTEEERKDIEKFKEFVRLKREQEGK